MTANHICSALLACGSEIDNELAVLVRIRGWMDGLVAAVEYILVRVVGSSMSPLLY